MLHIIMITTGLQPGGQAFHPMYNSSAPPQTKIPFSDNHKGSFILSIILSIYYLNMYSNYNF